VNHVNPEIMLDRIAGFTRLTGYHSESAPTVLVVPTDLDVAGVDVAPPSFEVVTRDVKRRGRDEMIEYDRVLLTPPEI
jgi:hypothetical protein